MDTALDTARDTTRLSFASDYTQGCHPAILQALCEGNLDVSGGYGTDGRCERARDLIREACGAPHAAVHFLVGGTQANACVIDALLRDSEGVIAADTGHIATHEAGAIERGGHKVLTLAARDGKLDAGDVEEYLLGFEGDENHDHMVAPALVYVSQPTEYGTIYSRDELTRLSEVCHDHGLLLYVDGARLAYALAAPGNDVGLTDLARLTDAFYIGGTKCGALLGEAVVFSDPTLCPRFFTISKAHGALLAKGFVLGIQFETLFRDGLYERIGKDAVGYADQIRQALETAGIPQAIESPTNQVFALMTDGQARALADRVDLSFWERVDAGHVVMRLATSWATTKDECDACVQAILAIGAGRR